MEPCLSCELQNTETWTHQLQVGPHAFISIFADRWRFSPNQRLWQNEICTKCQWLNQGADPGFWSGGSRVLTPGVPWAQNLLKIAWTLHGLKKLLGARGAPWIRWCEHVRPGDFWPKVAESKNIYFWQEGGNSVRHLPPPQHMLSGFRRLWFPCAIWHLERAVMLWCRAEKKATSSTREQVKSQFQSETQSHLRGKWRRLVPTAFSVVQTCDSDLGKHASVRLDENSDVEGP